MSNQNPLAVVFTGLAGAVVHGGTSLFNSTRQRLQALQLELVRGQLRRDELEVGHSHRIVETVLRSQLDRANAEALSLLRAEQDRLAKTYPFAHGPGSLANAVRLFSQDAADPPPVVLLEPVVGEDAGRVWRDLLIDSEAELNELQGERLIYVATPDRPVMWPNDDLYFNDLQGRPAIIITPAVGADRLYLYASTCHLVSHIAADRMPKTLVLTIEFRQPKEHERFDFTRQYAPGSLKELIVRSPRMETLVPSPEEAKREYSRMGAMAVKFVVTRLIDQYYLCHRPAYDEWLEPLTQRATGSALSYVDLPELPLDAVYDPGYFLINRAVRKAGKRASAEIFSDVMRGLGCLFGSRGHDLTATPASSEVCRHLLSGVGVTAGQVRALEKAHSLLSSPIAPAQEREVVLASIAKVLALPRLLETRKGNAGGDRPRWSPELPPTGGAGTPSTTDKTW